MVNENIREFISELNSKAVLYIDHAYDNSIIGITSNGCVIYDYNKMVEEFMSDEDCSMEEAMEWIDYNTVGTGYSGEYPPIIMYGLDLDDLREDTNNG